MSGERHGPRTTGAKSTNWLAPGTFRTGQTLRTLLAGKGAHAGATARASRYRSYLVAMARSCVSVLVVLSTSAGCGTDEEAQPDLIGTRVQEWGCKRGSCAPLYMTACVANVGEAAAGAFTVALNRSEIDRARLAGLAAGEETCVEIAFASLFRPGTPFLVVDIDQEVNEAREDNNELRFPIPNRTRCDIVCLDKPNPTPPPSTRH